MRMKLIVSIASYEKRFSTLHLCLENLLHQSVKPDKLLLYLDKPYKVIPQEILQLQECGLEIRFASVDLKSHNKYFYTMQQYPDDLIITLDDDVLYPHDLISKLLLSYQRFPFAVSAGRVHRIVFDPQGFVMPYDFWEKEIDCYQMPSMELMANGVGGVLYPPGSMVRELFNVEKIQKLCLYGDDIWLKAMQILKGTPVVAIYQDHQHPPIIEGTQKCGLYISNKLQHRNDLYIKNVFYEYSLTKERIMRHE